MGEFVWGDEPEFQGAIQRAVVGDADAWDSSFDGAPQRVLILGRGGDFNHQEGLSEASGEALGDGEGVCKVSKVIVVLRIRHWQRASGGFEFFGERAEQLGQTAVSDLAEDGGLSEVFKIGHEGKG